MTSHKHRLILSPSGRRGDVPHNITVLAAAASLGVEIESVCGGEQTCGKCFVTHEAGILHEHGVTSTTENLTQIGEDEAACARRHQIDLSTGRLACAAHIIGDVMIHVPETSLARRQVIRKDAGAALTVTIKPAVRVLSVTVAPAVLGGAGDWSRLQAAIKSQWGITGLMLDPILLRGLQTALREDDWRVTVTLWHDHEVIRIAPGHDAALYGVSVDVGSTTVAVHLCDLNTGDVLATETAMNPQVRYGEDLMSRISYGNREPQGVNRMHRAIIRTLNELMDDAANSAGVPVEAVSDAVVVGNTVMLSLLLGIDPVTLGVAPFTLTTADALDIKARDLGLKSLGVAAYVHLLPSVAGYVGADNVGVLLTEMPNLDERVTLVVDIGTNAEILLGTRDGILAASSPTGPAFEGAQITHGQRAAPGAIERVRVTAAGVRYRVVGESRWSDELDTGESLGVTGICGSGIIEVVAALYLAGVINAGGRFLEGTHPNLTTVADQLAFVLAHAHETATGEAVIVTQKDVRAIQLAKGALYAGVKVLMGELGVTQVDRIKLAGAFGSYIDPVYAMVLGLIPDCDLSAVFAVGNAAGDGARIALLNRDERANIGWVVRGLVRYVETASAEQFQDEFVKAMHLPHRYDPFPHLSDLLPTADKQETVARRSRRPKRQRK